MKKFIVVVLVLSLVMSLTVMAQAEECNVELGTAGHYNVAAFEVDGADHWVIIEMGNTGERIPVRIDQKTYEAFLKDDEAGAEHHDSLWYVKTCKWISGAATDVADFVTFWN